MRVLAVIEPDAAEREARARSAAATLAKLRVAWTPDLVTEAPDAPADEGSLAGR